MAISFIFINTGINSSKLPAPEVSGGLRGELGIDKNINEENIDKYLLARYKHGGRTLPDVDCYGLVLEFFKNELKINLPLEQSITDVSQAPEGEKNFKKIVKYAEVTEKNLERDKIYLCGFYTKNNFLAHCGIVINNKILQGNICTLSY